jgi:putative ABC transport system ATP-binding protein
VLNDPPLLLADEPTGNLDEANGRVIIDSLVGRARAGAAVVIVTHRADITDHATRVLAIEGGRLTEGEP